MIGLTISSWQSLTEFYIEKPQIGFVKVLSGIAGAVEKGLFPVLRTVNLTLRHDETDSESQENFQQELLALVRRLKENRIPDELTNKVIWSVGNLIMHINSNTNIDGSACASDLPGHAMTEKSVHLSYDSIIESALKTLQGHTEGLTAAAHTISPCGILLENLSLKIRAQPF